ncbi:probable u3 small nucleolar rna-associated protein 11-like [Stylonychia lemnae]|uniref:U3 small nucleolar RNA-associated protein 11 n=1 Tax=Stylonychia lemnae TaxID=5949 RepID=A0A078AW34_STYLE|nr:probable u3 small nucleolar rna-associated protein 11-like [Stylonychia lemnae]|eukprot:CDW86680.1 probable u3 small nucleolar rna-associated protein 11-like [Stylonychia lemnae]
MSSAASWRNAIPRRMYRERRQLKSREHLGLLEKKRDYKRRAKDYQHKTNVIKKLAEKALQRNPDEFYHKMINAQVKDGEHQVIMKDNKEQIKRRKLDENKDISLVNLKRMVEKNKSEKIQNNLHMIDFPKQNQHIFFVSDLNEIKQKQSDYTMKQNEADNDFEDDEDDNINDDGEEIKQQKPKQKYLGEKQKYIEQLQRNQSQNKNQYKKLADALTKEQQLNRVQEALILDKHIKDKGKKRKIEDKETGRTSFKWFSERKR